MNRPLVLATLVVSAAVIAIPQCHAAASSPRYQLDDGTFVTCDYTTRKGPDKAAKRCQKNTVDGILLSELCPQCGLLQTARASEQQPLVDDDNETDAVIHNDTEADAVKADNRYKIDSGAFVSCDWTTKKGHNYIQRRCEEPTKDGTLLRDLCPMQCGHLWPSSRPSAAPTGRPSSAPSNQPSNIASETPSALPTQMSSSVPSQQPSLRGSASPSEPFRFEVGTYGLVMCDWVLTNSEQLSQHRCNLSATDGERIRNYCPVECGPDDQKRPTMGYDEGGTWDSYHNYRVVATPGFPTDDVIVAAVVMTPDRLPYYPEWYDCGPAFQRAFDEASIMGGGIVYVPPGHYAFFAPLIIPSNVVLRGSSQKHSGPNKIVSGTVLKVYYDGREDRGDPSFIQLNVRSGLKDLSIWYPEQDVKNVIPYSRTIDGHYTRTSDGELRDRTEEIHIENILLVNSYVGLSIDGNAVRFMARGLFGTPLNTGIVQRWSSSIPVYTDVEFSPTYWAESGLPNAPRSEDITNYLGNHGTGIRYGSSDNIFASNLRVSDYNIGFHFVNGPHAAVNGNMYGLEASRCNIGLFAEEIGPTFIIESSFEGRMASAIVNNRNPVGVFFEECKFFGEFRSAWDGRQARNLRFHTCTFDSTLRLGSSRVAVVSSTFDYSLGPPIHLEAWTDDVTLVGNAFSYNGDPVNRDFFDLNRREYTVSTSRVLLDPRPIDSKTYVPFQVNNYYKSCKPAANNLIIIGQGHGKYAASVDGTSDDAFVIQMALDDVSARGGGIVWLPPISNNGYAIRSPIIVPPGCELRSTEEGLHSFNSRGRGIERIPGAVLQIYLGRNGDVPAITLNQGSGFVGFTVYYPEQLMENITPYSVTVKATGDNSYVKNVQFVNSFDAVYFEGASGFLAENILAQHISRPFKVKYSSNGRFNRIMIRNEWDDYLGRLTTNNGLALAQDYAIENCIAYEVVHSTGIEIYASFTRLSNWLAKFTDSQVRTLQFKMEASQNGIQVQGGDVMLIGTSIRTKTDIPGHTLTMFDVSRGQDGGFGSLEMFSTFMDGYPDTILRANDTDVLIQNSAITLVPEKPPSRGIELVGEGQGVVRMENIVVGEDRAFVTTHIPKVEGKRLELVASFFADGLDYFRYKAEDISTDINAPALEDVRVVDVGTTIGRAISAPMGTKDAIHSGLQLKTVDYDIETKAWYFKNTYSTLSGFVPTGYPSELLFGVTASPFTGNDMPLKAKVKFFYYDWEPGMLSVEYKLPGDSNYWKVAREIVLRGDNGFQLGRNRLTDNPYFFKKEIVIEGGMFQVGSELRLTTRTGKAMFMHVTIEEQPKNVCKLVTQPIFQGDSCWPDEEDLGSGAGRNADKCVPCTNTPSEQMINFGRTCEGFRLTEKKCAEPQKIWLEDKICKKSCYRFGYAYDSDICCP